MVVFASSRRFNRCSGVSYHLVASMLTSWVFCSTVAIVPHCVADFTKQFGVVAQMNKLRIQSVDDLGTLLQILDILQAKVCFKQHFTLQQFSNPFGEHLVTPQLLLKFTRENHAYRMEASLDQIGFFICRLVPDLLVAIQGSIRAFNRDKSFYSQDLVFFIAQYETYKDFTSHLFWNAGS